MSGSILNVGLRLDEQNQVKIGSHVYLVLYALREIETGQEVLIFFIYKFNKLDFDEVIN